MSLIAQCRGYFSNTTREKGFQYYQSKCVDIESLTDSSLEAHVEGSRLYDVTLDWHTQTNKTVELSVYCSCPHFEDGNFCKHLWATIIAADRDKRIDRFISPGAKIKMWDRLEDVDFDDEDEWGDEQIDERTTPKKPSRKTKASWHEYLRSVKSAISTHTLDEERRRTFSKPRARRAWFRLNLDGTERASHLDIDLLQQEMKVSGNWGKLKPLRIAYREISSFQDPADQKALSFLLGCQPQEYQYRYSPWYDERGYTHFTVAVSFLDTLLPLLTATNRFGLLPGGDNAGESAFRPLDWKNDEPWRFELEIQPDQDPNFWKLWGHILKNGDAIDLSEPQCIWRDGILLRKNQLSKIDFGSPHEFQWLAHLTEHGPLSIPKKEEDQLVRALLEIPSPPKISFPEELKWNQVAPQPRPRLSILPQKVLPQILRANLSFDYQGNLVRWNETSPPWIIPEEKTVIVRSAGKEQEAIALLKALKVDFAIDGYDLSFQRNDLATLVKTLEGNGWYVEAEGARIKTAGSFKAVVSSGVDWFDLNAECAYDGGSVCLPRLLAAVERGELFIKLGDGTFGMLPETWLKKFGSLANLGQKEGENIRFQHAQVAILDLLISDQPAVELDEKYEKAREQLKSFSGIEPIDALSEFQGVLRHYQKEGLGWLHFLQEFGFGGCLADDMGLGKTVQVLAFLQRRVKTKSSRAPSLVVCPKSVVYNWIAEAKRFTPELHVAEYAGLERDGLFSKPDDYDLIIMTYGVFRRDILKIREIHFDYAILDEAQNIKNENAHVAKSSRLIQADHRLALSGTPVENHLGELASIFEFLNPGMLTSSSRLKPFMQKGGDLDFSGIELLGKALRPFILRRTKEKVLTELPEKTEQTIYCDLNPKQKIEYVELRDHYRERLNDTIKREGMARSKIHVLEALLRLRQAACHPGLLDKSRVEEESAKLETLIGQVREVVESGHKALIFSQFTTLLSILRHRLDREGFIYEYLDGKTRDRKEKVERFQSDKNCPLFLVSLKAGGLGLNLTAADYCFILDPWWNPFVEAQAIDRAHRIGQTKRVFAYRLIARNTVEEKIIELQSQKRKLADAIVSADTGFLKSLQMEDLQVLFS